MFELLNLRLLLRPFSLVLLLACLAQPLSLQPVWGQDETADFDFTSLAHPETAENLQLSDPQRTQVASLVAELAAKTSAAAEAERPAIASEYAAKLKALLTPEQLVKLAELPELRKLQFNFGSQNWEDVLRWFAKQADLSLVMSSAPSGSFNYTDTNQYTPSQAINLLNSILLTKGYTLVRRDKLLILVEVSGGIPDEILPRVTVAELEKRGSFEIVSVMFTLGSKPAATVMAEVKPLLGSYGKMALLPQSNQLLVTETVGKMKAINMLIASIPAPTTPTPPAEKPPPPPPVLESYPLGSLDFEATATTIKSISPSAIVSGGPATQKIIVYAPPAQQELIKNLLDRLNSGTPVQDQAPRLQVYQLDKPVDPKQFAEQMALVAPQAKVAVDAAGNRVMVFAGENQQKQVAQSLETLGAMVVPDKSAQVRLFSLRRADPTVASQMAQAVSPRATVNVDTATKTLIVRALPAELEIIAQLVDQLDNAAAQQGLALKSYDFPRGTHTEFLAVLAGIAPKAKIQVDDRAGKLLVIAEERDQQALEGLITQYQNSKQGATPAKLNSYEVTAEQKSRFQALQSTLPNEFGKLQVIPDDQPNRLTIWADAGQHELVTRMLEDLKAQLPDQSLNVLKSYETSVEDLANLQTLLQPKFPGAKITANTAGDRLLVWASPEQQEAFAAQLAALTTELPKKEKPYYESYPLAQAEHARATEVLQPLAPTAKITSDPTQQRLLVWAVAKDQEIIKSSLTRLFEAAGTAAPNLVTIPLDGLDATSTTALLKTLVPRAQVTLDTVTQQLVVVGTDADQSAVRKVIDQLQSGLKLKEEPNIKFYPLEPAQSAAAVELLTQLVPGAKPQFDRVGKQLSVIATNREHEKVAKALGDLQAGVKPQSTPNLVVYPLAADLRPRFDAVLASLTAEIGELRIVDDKRPGEVAILASPAQHELIKQVLLQVAQPIEGADPFVFKAYPTGSSEPKQLVEFITQLFPAAKVVADDSQLRLLVWAPEKVHAELVKVLKEFIPEQAAGGNNARSLQAYKLSGLPPTIAIPLLQQMVPRMQLTGNDVQGLLLAWGRANEHQLLKAAVDHLNLPEDPRRLMVKVYPTEEVDPQIAALVLGKLLPDAVVAPNVNGKIIAVMARQDQQAMVVDALAQMQDFNTSAGPLEPVAYSVEKLGSTATVAALTPVFPQAKFFPGATATQLVAVANSDDHQKIKETLAQLASLSPTADLTLRVFQLRPELAAQVRPLITAALPNLKILGTAPDTLPVLASEEDQKQVQNLIAQAEQQLVATPKTIKPYTVEKLTLAQARASLLQKIPTLSTVELGGDPRVLYLLATEEEHATAGQVISELEAAIVPTPPANVVLYPLEDLDLTQLTSLLPAELTAKATIKPDPLNELLIVTAPEEVQSKLATTIAELAGKLPKADKVTSRIYPLGGLRSRDWSTFLTTVAPGAVAAFDRTSGSLVVVGTRATHEKVSKLLEDVRLAQTAGKVARPYRISKADVTAVTTVLTTLFPEATLTPDATSRSLFAIATEEDQVAIEKTLSEIDVNAPLAPVPHVYPISSGDATALAAALKSLVPAATFVPDATGRSLLALASTEEHSRIKQTVDQWTSDPARTLSTKVYQLAQANPATTLPILQKLLPAVTLTADPATRSIAAAATEEQHKAIAQAVSELDAVDSSVTTKIYPLGNLTAKDWQSLLTQLAPGAIAAADPSSGSLIVAGTADAHEKVASLMEEFKTTVTEGKVARAYRLSKADATVASQALATLLPNAQVNVDKTSSSLIIVATEEEQKTAATTLEQIDLNAPGSPVTQVYAIASGDATALATALKSLIPSAAYVPDASGKSLLVLASAEEQAQIKQTVELWTSDPARTLSTKVYQLTQANPATTLPILQKLLPAVTFTADPATRSVAAAATEDQHKAIAQAVSELDAVDSSVTTKIYPLGNLTAKDWQSLLTQLAPGAIAAADPDSGSLIVAAPAATHLQIAELMEEFKTAITSGKVARAYRLSKADAAVAAEAISALLPNSKVSVDKTSRSLLIVATEEDQATASKTIEQIDLNAPGAPVSEVYAVNTGDATELATALKGLVPGASYVADKAGKSLLVLATPDEQVQIKKTVEQWTGDPSRALTTKVYQLTKADPTAALPVLQKLLPSVTFSADPKTRAIAATATSEQHQSIVTAVTELDKLSSQAVTKIYPSGGLLAKDWQALVTQLAPDAVTAVDPDSGSLIVAARPDIHEQLSKLVDEFRNATTLGKSVRAYRLTRADPQVAADAITALSPTSRVSVDKTSKSIVVVTNQADQELIAQTVQQIDREATGAAISKIYPVATGDSAALATALKSLVPSGTYVADASGKSLLVIASPQDQEVLGKTVADWGGDANRAVTSKVYGFENADPTTALTALQKLIPGATLAADPATRSLLATGTGEQHELLAATVAQLDGIQTTTGEVTLKTYVVNRAPADSIAKALGDLFKKDTQVSIAADKETNSLIAIARPRQHEMIKAMVSASEKEMSDASFGSQIQIYPLANTDGKALVGSLEKLFQRQRPAPEITYDEKAQQLIVMGNAAQQALVQQLVVRLTGEQQEFEMFRLTTVDPFTAESAINGLFRNEPRSTAPSIQTDFDNSYLFIRASQPQMTRIREVLRKLGEPQTSNANLGPTNNLMRVVPLGTDSEQIIDRLNKLWPQLQPNELRIIDSPPNQPGGQGTPRFQRGPAPAPDSPPQPVPNTPDKSTSAEPASIPSALARFATRQQELPGGTTTLFTPQDPNSPDLSLQEKAPVFVIPGNRQLTIASSDPAAIQQLEDLIKAIAGPIAESQTSGNFETFALKNAGASEVAEILKDLFKGMGDSKRTFGPPIVITADDRLNLLVVHGSRSDRETIGKLADVLDSPDINDAFSINQPEIVTVRNTDAARILTILQNVYRSQLSSGGGRRSLPIPEGVSTEMATMLQQINAATSGPLLTLGVDVVTNSIIVLAPQQLRDQVKATIAKLDANVEVEPGEKIEIIQLKETNPARIQRAIDLLFKQGPK